MFKYILPYWKKEVAVLSLSGIGVILGLINPYLAKLVIDKVYGARDLKLFIVLILAGGGIFLLSGAASGLENYINRYIRLRVNLDLNRKLFKRFQALPYSFFQATSTGGHLFKISYDTEQMTRFITDVLPKAVSLLPRSIFIFFIIFFLSRKMALLALVLTPFLYIIPYYFSRRLKGMFRIWVENSQGIFAKLKEVLSNMHLVKAFGKEKEEEKYYIGSLIKNIRLNLKNTKIEVFGSFSGSMINRLSLGLIICYGGYQVIKGTMTLGSLAAITIYLNQLSGLQGSMGQFFQSISLGAVSCDRLNAILNARVYPALAGDTKDGVFIKGDIEFKNVSFAYKADKPVLKDLTFNIKGGSRVGLTGPSGCGKTTIVNLMLRVFRPDSGKILIDGLNIADMNPKSFYGQIGVVLQEPYLWNDTILNNIRYAERGANLSEVREAARVAFIDGFVERLPQKYDTVIGENACKVSEGQKQRIAIARALIKKPKILILDEALSSVETELEEKIIGGIKDYSKDTTLIVITHRPSTLKLLDLTYHMTGPGSIEMHEGGAISCTTRPGSPGRVYSGA